MPSRRQFLKAALFAGATAATLPAVAAVARAAAPARLSWQAIPAGANGFFRAPVLLTGPTEAVLIDGGFTYADGQAVVAALKASGKTLTTVYVSQSDPDYYFSLKPVRDAFPQARILTASATVAAIRATVEKKLAVWGPQLKDNGPQSLADIVIPEAFDGPALSVDGETVEILTTPGMTNRRTLWVPSLQALFGGVLIFSGVHVWVADTPTKAERAAWLAALEGLAARQPAVVVAGHLAPGSAFDRSAIDHTRRYLLAFEEELEKAADSAALKAAMESRFPGLGMGVALEIGAKVAKGEMKWG